MQIGQMARETAVARPQAQRASNRCAAGVTTPSRLPPKVPPRTPELLGAHLVSALDSAMDDSFDGRRLSIGGIANMVADVDMDIDLDVFRPSAMLDARLEEEFGSALTYAFGTDHSQRDDEFVDIEHVLLSDVDDCSFRQHRTASQAARSGPLLRSTSLSGPSAVKTSVELPPKYFRSVSASPSKPRVHRRTFGERSKPFAFQNSDRQPRTVNKPITSVTMDENTPPTNGQCVIKTEQPLVAATPVFSSGLDDIKHEVMASGSSFEHGIAVTPSPLCFSRAPLRAAAIQAGHEGMLALEESLDDEMDGTTSAPEEPDLHISAPSSAEAAAAAARASTLLLHQRMDAMVAGSPLYRRSISSPQPSSTPHNTALLHTPVVPSQQHHHKPAISPAATFNKVSVVHAKDTPGKVDKFEWRIRSKATMASPRTDLLACGDDADSSSASSAADSLPPRYFRAVTGSPTKRRVHSTTFGAFARSFSFNTSE